MSGPIPEPEALRRAIDALEPYAGHPATGHLHDPLYALLSDPDPAHVDAFAAALARYRNHPAVPALRALLGAHLALPARTVADVLQEHGPLAEGVDPVDEVEHRLVRAAEVHAVLERRVSELEQDRGRLAATANAMAAVAALLAVVAFAGWLVALGGWKIDWIEPPAPSDVDAPAQPAR